MEFVDRRKTPFVPIRSRGELPHLHKPAAFYFVTFRLADAVIPSRSRPRTTDSPLDDPDPAELLADHEPPLTLGCCALHRPEVAAMVQQALLFFEGERYSLGAWCVMPNHVHVVLAPVAGHALAEILHSWKSFTAKKANRILGQSGAFWERESFDHLIRTPRAVQRFADYVEQNPVVAGLCDRPEDWPYGSAAYRAQHDRGSATRDAGGTPAPQ